MGVGRPEGELSGRSFAWSWGVLLMRVGEGDPGSSCGHLCPLPGLSCWSWFSLVSPGLIHTSCLCIITPWHSHSLLGAPTPQWGPGPSTRGDCVSDAETPRTFQENLTCVPTMTGAVNLFLCLLSRSVLGQALGGDEMPRSCDKTMSLCNERVVPHDRSDFMEKKSKILSADSRLCFSCTSCLPDSK